MALEAGKDSLVMRKQLLIGGTDEASEEVHYEARTRTFVAWINSTVKERGVRVKNLGADLENGIVLLKLLESLVPGKSFTGRSVSV